MERLSLFFAMLMSPGSDANSGQYRLTKVSCGEGASAAVTHCGGVAAILKAHGVALEGEHSGGASLTSGPVIFPMSAYQSLVHAIRGGPLAKEGKVLLPTPNLIPLPTLAAFRCMEWEEANRSM